MLISSHDIQLHIGDKITIILVIKTFAFKSVSLGRNLIAVIILSCNRKFLNSRWKTAVWWSWSSEDKKKEIFCCGQRNKIHFRGVHLSSPRCQKGTRRIYFWPLTPVSRAHQHAHPGTICGGKWCTSFTSRLGMEHGVVLLSLCLTQRTVSSVSLVLISTITTLQKQKVTMNSDRPAISKQTVCMWVCLDACECVCFVFWSHVLPCKCLTNVIILCYKLKINSYPLSWFHF